MADTLPSLRLTSDGAMKLLNAAMAKAKEMGVPQCISIVDSGGHLLAFGRMDGAFSQSIDTSLMKAMTAASYGIPTGDIAAGIDLKLAIATKGKRINLPGGLPIIVDTVEQRTGGKRFEKLEDVISQDELRTIFERYQKVAGYHVQQVGRAQG